MAIFSLSAWWFFSHTERERDIAHSHRGVLHKVSHRCCLWVLRASHFNTFDQLCDQVKANSYQPLVCCRREWWKSAEFSREPCRSGLCFGFAWKLGFRTFLLLFWHANGSKRSSVHVLFPPDGSQIEEIWSSGGCSANAPSKSKLSSSCNFDANFWCKIGDTLYHWGYLERGSMHPKAPWLFYRKKKHFRWVFKLSFKYFWYRGFRPESGRL